MVIACSGGDSQGEAETEAQHASASANEPATVGKPAPDFTLTSVAGNQHSLSEFTGNYVVLEWINFDCPFVKKHYGSDNMPMLQEKYREQGVVWLTICSSAPGKQGHFEGETLTSRIEAEGWNGDAYLIDTDGKVGRMYGAETTPHMYIIDMEGDLVYAGAIDDKPSVKPEDIPQSTNYVVAAFDNLMSGQEVETKTTKAYGCSVKY
ncbi:redoxin domain-containing protein [candidate division GN15 bacterium]|nr:redoxin domain-containing protein [candidate division GN15 bacterium]